MALMIFNFMPDTQSRKQTVLATNHFYVCSLCKVRVLFRLMCAFTSLRLRMSELGNMKEMWVDTGFDGDTIQSFGLPHTSTYIT